MIATNAHSLGVIILLLIVLRCLLGDWTQAALMSGLGVGQRLAIQPDLHLSRFAHLRLIKSEVMKVRGPERVSIMETRGAEYTVARMEEMKLIPAAVYVLVRPVSSQRGCQMVSGSVRRAALMPSWIVDSGTS